MLVDMESSQGRRGESFFSPYVAPNIHYMYVVTFAYRRSKPIRCYVRNFLFDLSKKRRKKLRYTYIHPSLRKKLARVPVKNYLVPL